MYGIGWEGDEGRSDVKSVCGDYPAVISFDLGELELGGDANLDKVPFDKMKQEIANQSYQKEDGKRNQGQHGQCASVIYWFQAAN